MPFAHFCADYIHVVTIRRDIDVNEHERLSNDTRVMVFNATFNNISVISWWSVLLMEETGENHRPVASNWQALSHNVVSSTPRLSGILTHNVIVMVRADCIAIYKIQLPYDDYHDGPFVF